MILVLKDSPLGAMFAKHILRMCSDNPCEAAVALTGVCGEGVIWGCHAPLGTDAEASA